MDTVCTSPCYCFVNTEQSVFFHLLPSWTLFMYSLSTECFKRECQTTMTTTTQSYWLHHTQLFILPLVLEFAEIVLLQTQSHAEI